MNPKDNPVVALPTLEELRRHVLETLCAHDQLDPGQTPFFQSLVTRSEQVCGLFFRSRDQGRVYAPKRQYILRQRIDFDKGGAKDSSEHRLVQGGESWLVPTSAFGPISLT